MRSAMGSAKRFCISVHSVRWLSIFLLARFKRGRNNFNNVLHLQQMHNTDTVAPKL
jgi:hypothetical protein